MALCVTDWAARLSPAIALCGARVLYCLLPAMLRDTGIPAVQRT
jgi:hypothetical protein